MALALTAVGAAAGGTQAVISVDDYAKKQELRSARTGDKQHDLIDKETVDAAAVKAIIDTVFAFIDLVGAAKAIHAAGAVDDIAAKVGKLGELAGAEKEGAFKTALDVMGPPEGARRGRRPRRGARAARRRLRRPQARRGLQQRARRGDGSEPGRQAGARAGRQADRPDAIPDRPPPSPGAGPAPAPDVKPPEDLLKQAQDFASTKTGLPPERALKTVAPAADSLDEITLVIKRGAAASADMSDEYAQLATKEARMAKVHEKAVEWARGRKFPPPGSSFGDAGPLFDPQKWAVVYNGADLSAKEATNAAWEFLQGTGVHEMRHAQQWFDMARVALSKIRGGGRGHRPPPRRPEGRSPGRADGRRRPFLRQGERVLRERVSGPAARIATRCWASSRSTAR